MRCAISRWLWASTLAACSIDTAGLGGPDGGRADGGATDAAVDASMPDSATAGDGGPDAGEDAGPDDAGLDAGPCKPATETCNAGDDDCDGAIDEEGCAGCERLSNDGRQYLFCTDRKSWDEGRAWCMDRGWDLVVLGTAAEQDWVWARARERLDEDWYPGLSDLGVEGTYEWVDGTVAWAGGRAVGYANFRGGTPCDVDTEDCIELDAQASPSGTWADTPCSQIQPFICELR